MSRSLSRFRPWAVPGAALLLLSACATMRSTPADPAEVLAQESPLVERVTFQGSSSIRLEELRKAVFTQQTRCRGTFLLKPICELTQWSAMVEREYLERPEVERDELRLEVLHFRRGYREASVSSEIHAFGRGVEVVYTIEEGEPTIVQSFSLTQTEPLLTNRQIRRALLPQKDEPLDLERLEAGLFELRSRLAERGYLDAKATDHIEVSADRRTASLDIVVDPERRSTLGELAIDGNEKIEDGTIEEAMHLRSGRVLRSSDLVASQRSLYESNLFHEARVVLPEQADSAKRVEITVREAPARSMRAGAGFNTADFLQVELRYLHYNWRGRGRRMDTYLTVGNLFAHSGAGVFHVMGPLDEAFFRPTWQAGAELMQPGFLSTENRVGFGVFTHRRSLPSVVVDQGYGANASVTRRLDFRTPVSLEYKYEMSEVEAGDLYFCANHGICDLPSIASLQGRHQISPLGLGVFSDHADDPLSPKSGYRLRLELQHASAFTLSDFRYNRVAAEASGYLPIGLLRQKVLAARVRAGWVQALPGTWQALGLPGDGLALLHPRVRFFAGGSRSVRGFGENQLGPLVLTIDPAFLVGGADPLCTQAEVNTGTCDPSSVNVVDFVPRPVGGRAVLEGSVEYRFPVFRSFQGATFVDAGFVTGGAPITSGNVGAITPGFGIRYASPIAPIRVDLAFRPSLPLTLPVVTEVIDPQGVRQLVRLRTPVLYDPTSAGSNGWDTFMNRLRLHVSIGQAF